MGTTPNKSFESRDLKQCAICSRRFTVDRIKAHESICQKSAVITRKFFNVSQQRIRGTDFENISEKIENASVLVNNGNKDASPLSTNWRWKHDELIKSVKRTKENKTNCDACEQVNLPLCSTVDYNDYIQCPHCLRKFNQPASQRHIAMCAKLISSKSKSKDNLTTNSKSESSQFLLKKRVLRLYKNFFHLTRVIPEKVNRTDVQDWIRSDFKSKKTEKNQFIIQLCLQNGERALKELETNISLSQGSISTICDSKNHNSKMKLQNLQLTTNKQ